ncbi:hypothetical protein [Parageobacillus thermoglucosidasius]|uniref:Mobile element protein n=1 Tax=Parageobacillus thermoglucosidasius TaxID=1426 RepID=A0AB38QU51_PARTM|nr:hypothetical protein [Parageobacillus thermoglucosidasius]MED4905653.1 hypothetical protein [Parageobacillus thermoglucosidasius]MED4914039.1 hypothetical protein [Parageobacillus thermoglucosidasius]MED4945726.1 hypothetical protein [Parageobacillus thermoglucosidasius]MED4981345.1 hypothetical protein [Parageobacillus thermoglucosidasius]UOE75049.1 hypothetical protein IMI45_11875 [Parageobacillus thermoglucosidasius]
MPVYWDCGRAIRIDFDGIAGEKGKKSCSYLASFLTILNTDYVTSYRGG